MVLQKKLIIFESYHHRNTGKIAQVIAQVLQSELCTPDQVDLSKLSDFDMIGIGSGIYFGKPHENIIKFFDSLPFLGGKKAFTFLTSGAQKEKYFQYIRERVELKGMQLVAHFSCKGFNNHGSLKLVGGINKGHPNIKDLFLAEIFANSLLIRL